MKIDPGATRPLVTQRLSDAAGGPSFNQLIEQGGSADQVLSGRALGFAESGLLGVHNALMAQPGEVAALAARPATDAHAETRPQRQTPCSGPLLISAADLLRDSSEPVPSVSQASQTPAGLAAAAPPPAAIANADPAAFPTQAVAASPGALALDPAEPDVPDVPAPVRVAWVRSGSATRDAGLVRFELHMLDSQLASVVTDMAFDRLDEHDLTRIRDTAAREFGVTVGRIVIRPKLTIFSNNQGGN